MTQSDPPRPNAAAASPGPPPSASGLFLKVLVLPTLAVFVLVAVWVMFRSLTVSPDTVESYLAQLEQKGNARWRAAVGLAGVLRDPDRAALKRDPALAARLVEILRRETDAGGMEKDDLTLRFYLCRALGELELSDGLPALLEAAATQRDPREVGVRRSAIEALAVLAGNLGPEGLRSQPDLVPVLLEASEDRRPSVRSAAAFTLGVIGGPEAENRLAAMLSDGYADVRYNAATGLARHGDARAVPVLLEMLDPDETAGVEVEKQQAARDFKRAMILVNALRATEQLAAADPKAIDRPLLKAVRRLGGAEVPDQVRVKAREVLAALER